MRGNTRDMRPTYSPRPCLALLPISAEDQLLNSIPGTRDSFVVFGGLLFGEGEIVAIIIDAYRCSFG